MRTQYEELLEIIKQLNDHYHNYVTEHEDSGDCYAHLVSENWYQGSFQDEQIKTRLEHLCIKLSNSEFDDLTTKLKHRGNWEMVSGSMFYPTYTDGIYIESYSIGEVENQIEVKALADEVGTKHIVPLLRKVEKDGYHCIRYTPGRDCFETYQATDSVWYAVIRDEEILEVIEEMEEEKDDRDDL